MDYTVVYSRRKTLGLQMTQLGKLFVKAPIGTPRRIIEGFVLDHNDWITKQFSSIMSTLQPFESVLSRKNVLFLGNYYEICYQSGAFLPYFSDKKYVVPQELASEDLFLAGYKKMLKKLSLEYVTERLGQFVRQTTLEYAGVKILSAKNNWGTCNSARRLSFNWRIVMLPPHLIDYIIIHELCHTIHLNHSARFWSEVNRYAPEYQAYRRELKRYSFLNLLYQ